MICFLSSVVSGSSIDKDTVSGWANRRRSPAADTALPPHPMPSMPAQSQHPHAIGKNSFHFRRTVNALLIVDGDFDNTQMEFTSAEKEFVVSPQVFDAPAAQIFFHLNP